MASNFHNFEILVVQDDSSSFLLPIFVISHTFQKTSNFHGFVALTKHLTQELTVWYR